MSDASNRIQQRRIAQAAVAKIVANASNVVVIHYSCESFYDRHNGASPRITSIAVRNLSSAQTTSFSIHQVAERDKKRTTEEIEAGYDDLEKKMLKEFYEYVETHKNHFWLHWNMRDINYGFPAIAHRFKVLDGKPTDIHESQLFDLARILVGLFGVGYAGHPRLTWLVDRNKISDRDWPCRLTRREVRHSEAVDFVEDSTAESRFVALMPDVHPTSFVTDQTIQGR